MSANPPTPTSAPGERPSRLTVGGRSVPFGLLAAGIIVVLLVIACGCFSIGPLSRAIDRALNRPKGTEVVEVPTETSPPTDQPTDVVVSTEISTEQVTDGACNAVCNPDAPNCLAGLECLPRSSTANAGYICWNKQICLGNQTTPVVTQPSGNNGGVTPPPAECGPGWLPAAGCSCCGTTLVCANGTIAQFNPQCGVGGQRDTQAPNPYCGDGICNGSENCWTCLDCGICKRIP